MVYFKTHIILYSGVFLFAHRSVFIFHEHISQTHTADFHRIKFPVGIGIPHDKFRTAPADVQVKP